MNEKRQAEISLLILKQDILNNGITPRTVNEVAKLARDVGIPEREARRFGHAIARSLLEEIQDLIKLHSDYQEQP